MAYLLDTNVFMEAKNRYYGLDFCPAFWEWLIHKNNEKVVFSIEKVGDEIRAGDDELADWAADRSKQFFLKADAKLLSTLPIVSEWVSSNRRYTSAAANTFLISADYYLVAHALAHGHSVVTHEKPSASIHKVKIPEVCIGLNVKFVNPFEILRHERARFILGPHKTG
jgi:predicted nucleic acid-binding protein